MDDRSITQNLAEAKSSEQKERFLRQIVQSMREQGGMLMVADLSKLFAAFENCLRDPSLEVTQLTLSALTLALSDPDPQILLHFVRVLHPLATHLAHANIKLREEVVKCFSSYIKQSSNIESVLQAVCKSGVESTDWKLRHYSLQILCRIIASQPSVVSVQSIEMRRVAQTIVLHLKDPSETVQDDAKKVLIDLTERYADFHQITRKLSVIQRSVYDQIIEEEKLSNLTGSPIAPQRRVSERHTPTTKTHPSRIGLMEGNAGGISPKLINRKGTDMGLNKQTDFNMTAKEILRDGKQTYNRSGEGEDYIISQNNYVFGIIPQYLMNDLTDATNWKKRTTAIEELERIINEQDISKRLEPYLSSFLRFTTKLLNDPNFKISLTTLHILAKLMSVGGINLKGNLQNLVPGLVEKLGDNKIVIRQTALHAFRSLLVSIRQRTVVQILIPYLQNKNWHIREQILNVIILLFIDHHHTIECDYTVLMNAIAQLFDDPKPKVIQIVYETITTIAMLGDRSRVLEILYELMQKDVYDKLCDRIEAGNIPFVNSEGNLEYPYIHSGINANTNNNMNNNMNNMNAQAPFTTYQRNAPNASHSMIYDMQSPAYIPSFMEDDKGPGTTNKRFTSAGASKPLPKRKLEYLQTTDLEGRPQTENIRDEGDIISPTFGMSVRGRIDSEQDPYEKQFTGELGKGNYYQYGESPTNRKSPIVGESDEVAAKVRMWLPKHERSNKKGEKSPEPSEIENRKIKMREREEEHSSYIPSEHVNNQPKRNLSILNLSKQNGERKSVLSNVPSRGADSTRANTVYSSESNQSSSHSMNTTSGSISEKLKLLKSGSRFKSATESPMGEERYSEECKSDNLSFYSAKDAETEKKVFGKSRKLPIDSKYETSGIVSRKYTDNTGNTKSYLNYNRKGPVKAGTLTDEEDYSIPSFNSLDSQPLPRASSQKRFSKRKYGMKNKLTEVAKQKTQKKEREAEEEVKFSDAMAAKPPQGSAKKGSMNTSKYSIFNQEEKEIYLEEEDLEPLNNPELEYNRAMASLKSKNWSQQFEALNVIRAVSVHHSYLITASALVLHNIILDLIKLVNSMRSSLAKNALLTFKDMFKYLKRCLDPDIDIIILALIKKGIDTNAFLSNQANEGLVQMCECCDERRLVISLANITAKAAAMKVKICFCYDTIIHRMGNKLTTFKEIDRMITILAQYVSEGSQDVRNSAKQCLVSLSNELNSAQEFDRLLQRILSDSKYNQLKSIMGKEDLTKYGEKFFVTNSTSFRGTNSGFRKTKQSGKGVLRGGPTLRQKETQRTIKEYSEQSSIPPMGRDIKLEGASFSQGDSSNPYYSKSEFNGEEETKSKTQYRQKMKYLPPGQEPEQFENIPVMMGAMASNEWKVRLSTINSLVEFCEDYDSELNKSTKFVSVIEMFSKGINDSNIKVSIRALDALEKVIPLLKTGIEHNLMGVMNALNNSLSSTNTVVKNKADLVVDLLIDTIENVYLIQPLVHLSIYGNKRAKPAIIQHLNEIIPEVHRTKPILLTKHVLPAAYTLLEESKTEIKTGVIRMIQILYENVGSQLLENAPQNRLARILEIVSGK